MGDTKENGENDSNRPHGIKMIDFEKGTLSVAKDGSELLKGLDAHHPLNLLFIFGNARSGKSFLMNRLVGLPGVFKVINSSTPCTRGVDISSHFSTNEELQARLASENLDIPSNEPKNGEKKGVMSSLFSVFKSPKSKASSTQFPLLGFVDVEGQGAEDGNYDTMLALPLLLTSKVVLFNHKGAPTVSDMLSKLGVLARAADYIDLGNKVEGDEEDDETNKKRTEEGEEDPEGGGDGEDDENKAVEDKPILDDATRAHNRKLGRKKKFGHLHVIFRDFNFTGSQDTVYQQLMGKEKEPKKKPATMKQMGIDPAKPVQERNTIRQMLLENFQSIQVWLFKIPASGDELLKHNELPIDLIDPQFNETLKKLLASVQEQMKEPTQFHGVNLDGPKMLSIVSKVCKALNQGGAINVPSVYKAMEKETVNRIGEECIQKFIALIEEIKKVLPLPSNKLNEQINDAKDSMLKRYDAELSECLLETEKKNKKDAILATATKLSEDIIRENSNATLVKIKRVINAEMERFKEKFEKFCQEKMPIEEGKLLVEQFSMLKKQSLISIKDALEELPGAFELPEAHALLIEKEEMLQEFLTLKTVQNESMIKDTTINKLREEHLKVQQQLIEKNSQLEKFLSEEKENTKSMQSELSNLRDQISKERKQESERKQELEKKLEESKKELEQHKKQKCIIL